MIPYYSEIQTYLKGENVEKAELFGSFARGDSTSESDIDLLISKKGMTLFDILQMEEDLEKIINRKIDIVEYSAIKPNLRNHLLHRYDLNSHRCFSMPSSKNAE